MEKFVSYFWAVNLLVLLQVAYYRIFLARQQRFVWNRIYLLGGMAVALVLPLLQWRVVPPSLPNPSFIRTLPEIVILPEQPFETVAATAPAWTVWEWVLGLYLIGVLVALVTLAWRNWAIGRLIWQGKKTRQDGIVLVETTADIGPASYFRYVFWKADLALDAQSVAVALAHERCHSRQLHSLDLLAVELFKAFCWMNPAVYLLRQDLRRNHEYLADQAALHVAGVGGIKRLLLLRQLDANALLIVHHFYAHVKARIVMLTKNSTQKSLLQYLLVLPLAAMMAACTSLAHPMDAPSADITLVSNGQASTSDASGTDSLPTRAAAAAGDRNATDTPVFFDLQESFHRATYGDNVKDPKKEGITCLGHMPQVLNLDTLRTAEMSAPDEPQLLNRDKVYKAMGYPKEAAEKKLKGKVVVKVLVDATGHVIRYQFIERGLPVFHDVVEAHVMELLFKPGLENNVPAEWWVIVPFAFGMPGC